MISKKKTIQGLSVIGIFVVVSIALGSVPSETLIEFIGSENAFVLMFVLGLVGGLTTFTGFPYQFVLMSLAAGGINPIGLGLCTGLGVVAGDSTMFLISKKFKSALPLKITNVVDTLACHLDNHPKLITPTIFLYGAFSPFSNDFIVASLSIMGYKYQRIIIPLAVGNIFFNITIAYLGLYAYDAVIGFF